jgi:hypothetical protein
LTWSASAGEGSPVDRYEVLSRRQGRGPRRRRRDVVDRPQGGAEIYDYQLIAVSADGVRAGATARAQTASAPAGTAALAGVFNATLHPTSHSGFSRFSDKDWTAGWRFVPQCKQAPCDTQLRDFHVKGFSITLDQAGGTYTGSVTASGWTHCGSAAVSSTFTVDIHLTQADAVNEMWKATKFTGTMTQYASAQFGCVLSSARYDVAGTLANT